jgi:excisionase family DNA binding protein
MTSADVARRLTLTPARVRQIAAAGRLPHTRTVRGTRLFLEHDVEAYARERDSAR